MFRFDCFSARCVFDSVAKKRSSFDLYDKLVRFDKQKKCSVRVLTRFFLDSYARLFRYLAKV